MIEINEAHIIKLCGILSEIYSFSLSLPLIVSLVFTRTQLGFKFRINEQNDDKNTVKNV
jgi:hypothetical protein